MHIVAWQLLKSDENGSLIIRLQATDVCPKTEEKLFSSLISVGWEHCGSSWTSTKEENIEHLFQKQFVNEKEWLEWGKAFPYSVVWVNANERTKKKIGKEQKTGKRQCKNCGEFGHNSKTCKNPKATRTQKLALSLGKKKTKRARKPCTCKKCGGKGHQTRSCKTK